MIKIKNIYYMIAYAFNLLKEAGYAKIETEEFDNVADFCAAILSFGMANQIKKGLNREYIGYVSPLSSLRGKINISSSIKHMKSFNKQLICEYDEFSENMYLNRIIKTTAMLLIRSGEVRLKHKRVLKKALSFFTEIDTLDPYSIQWSAIRYHRNNTAYKSLINICYLVLNDLLLTTQDGNRKLSSFLDEQQMHSLFERFVLAYYRKHFPHFSAAPSHIDWNIEGNTDSFLPTMRTDIMLKHKEKILIIDTKFYKSTMQVNLLFNSRKIHSNNLYQIFTYIKNKDILNTGNVSGVLLYAKTDEELTPDNDYIIHNMSFCTKNTFQHTSILI